MWPDETALPRKMSLNSAVAVLALILGSSWSVAAVEPSPAAPADQGTSEEPPAVGGADVQLNVKRLPPARHNTGSSKYQPDRFAGRAGMYYREVWGIDSVGVKLVESGELVRFSYTVLDPKKAAPLNDKSIQATLYDPRAGVSLAVPTMEKVGQLRQSMPPKAGRSYWMAFSNKGRLVRKGDQVHVEIGPFRAVNLVVD